MHNLYNVNGLVFWSDKEIHLRKMFEEYFANEVREILLNLNPAWKFHRVEAPQLTPQRCVSPNYSGSDIWIQDGMDKGSWLALRPETTGGSYEYAKYLLSGRGKPEKPPFVVWQSGKSFRREQEQVSKNMRLKEFYQQEFQCFFAADTLNDYHKAVLIPVSRMIKDMVGLPVRIVESDRLPSYSLKTMDVEVCNENKWMEICSISLRKDFTEKARFQAKKKIVEKDLLVLEIAIGLDRCVYNFFQEYNEEIPINNT